MDYDAFICHASEDKDGFVRALAEALRDSGLRVWYDEFSLSLGDSIRQSIDRGLANSRYGVVVLSPSFFAKHWPQQELNGLAQREEGGHKVILPVWHSVTHQDVLEFSPILADRAAVTTAQGIPHVVAQIRQVVGGGGAGNEAALAAAPAILYTHQISVHHQGQLNIRPGHIVEITEWFGPDGAGGSGQLRVARMTDLTDQRTYASDIASVMMTIIPVRAPVKGRVAGPIESSGRTVTFVLGLTDEEYAKFDANRVALE